MGQAWGRLGGKQWRDAQLKKISDRIFDKLRGPSSKNKLSFEELYIATLLVFNDINKYFPGPHLDPPTKQRVRELIQETDKNEDQGIDRDEFLDFIMRLTSDSFASARQRLIVTLLVAPALAVVTKKSTEGIPGVGKFVQKLPVSAYASLVTLAALIFQNSQQLLK